MNKLLLTALCATAFASSLYCTQKDPYPEMPRWQAISYEMREKQHPYNELIWEAQVALAYNDKAVFDAKVAQAKPLYKELISLDQEFEKIAPDDYIVTCDLAISRFPVDEKGDILPFCAEEIVSLQQTIPAKHRDAKGNILPEFAPHILALQAAIPTKAQSSTSKKSCCSLM